MKREKNPEGESQRTMNKVYEIYWSSNDLRINYREYVTFVSICLCFLFSVSLTLYFVDYFASLFLFFQQIFDSMCVLFEIEWVRILMINIYSNVMRFSCVDYTFKIQHAETYQISSMAMAITIKTSNELNEISESFCKIKMKRKNNIPTPFLMRSIWGSFFVLYSVASSLFSFEEIFLAIVCLIEFISI